MEFNFNYFFGYELLLNNLQDKSILIFFAILMYGEVFLILLSGYLRKFKITFFLSQLNILILSVGLTIFFGTIVSLLLYYLVVDCSIVKIVYCWIAIFFSMFYFSVFNYNKVKKFLMGFK